MRHAPKAFVDLPCTLMRGGTSKGPMLLRRDVARWSWNNGLEDILIELMGATEPRRVDGLAAQDLLFNKIAIVGPPTHPQADVDYEFVQITAENRVDHSVSCGNMLSAVGPFALEAGLVEAQDGLTSLLIHDVNTGLLIRAELHTPNGRPTYSGSAQIDGVPGTSAPIWLFFQRPGGSCTSGFLPTGNPRDVIDGIEMSLVDAATPMAILRAADLGKSGYESAAELDADRAFSRQIEALRQHAGRAMGLGETAGLTRPKLALVSSPQRGGNIASRYFMPETWHPAFAVTGAVCLSAAAACPGTVAHEYSTASGDTVDIEHPSGMISTRLNSTTRPGEGSANGPESVGLLRTARRLFSGTASVPLKSVSVGPWIV